MFSRSAAPFLEELQLVGQELVSLACLQSSLPSALYGLCISFQLCPRYIAYVPALLPSELTSFVFKLSGIFSLPLPKAVRN